MDQISELEELVLMAAAALGDDAYGLGVRDLLDREGRSATLATIHSALYRLENKGLLRSRLGGATEERGGRSKRIFEPTSTGFATLRDRRALRNGLYRLIPGI